MATFVIDENMARTTASVLQAAGHRVFDVCDVGLKARPDQDVFEYAQSVSSTIVTRDLGFASTVRFLLGSHLGIVVLRVLNEVTTRQVNATLLAALSTLTDPDFPGTLVIVEPQHTRVRRPER
jgi:predicted nuclease of predicted toxin-antitoxin system